MPERVEALLLLEGISGHKDCDGCANSIRRLKAFVENSLPKDKVRELVKRIRIYIINESSTIHDARFGKDTTTVIDADELIRFIHSETNTLFPEGLEGGRNEVS